VVKLPLMQKAPGSYVISFASKFVEVVDMPM
jgi:hypothetical protein